LWTRSVAAAHPAALVRQFRWDDDPSQEEVARDGEVVTDIQRPHRLTGTDIGSVPSQWLDVLMPQLETGERIARQRLRMVSVQTYTVRYRLGREEDHVAFRGRRVAPPPDDASPALARRAARLRFLSTLLILASIAAALLSLGRGTFYWSFATLLSLAAVAAALWAAYGGAAEWTAARRFTHRWVIGGAASIAIAIGFAAAAMPRLTHAEKLIASGKLDDAASELRALGVDVPRAWADLRLARIRSTNDVAAAQKELSLIPTALAQHAAAVAAIDTLILATASADLAAEQGNRAADALSLLSAGSRGKPQSIEIARSVYLPLCREHLARRQWAALADSVVTARSIGVAANDLGSVVMAMHTSAARNIAEANKAADPKRRLELRLSAEEILVASERTSESSNTPELMTLRAAMARDVATLERAARRHGRS
jgi:hypothetical protein